MKLRVVAPLVLAAGALAGCAGGASAPPVPALPSALPNPAGEGAASAWTTDLLATTCVERATAGPENASIRRNQEVHWDRARSGERPDGFWVVEVRYSETGGEFAGAEGSYYCILGGAIDAPHFGEWGAAVPFTDEQFASYVAGEWVSRFEPEP